MKRGLIATIIGFAFLFGFEWAFHGVYLMDAYRETAQLWRPEADMVFAASIGKQFLIAAILCYLFSMNFERKGIGEGIRFGLVIGLFIGVSQAGAYAYMPISTTLALQWFVGGLIEGLGLGILFAFIFGKCS